MFYLVNFILSFSIAQGSIQGQELNYTSGICKCRGMFVRPTIAQFARERSERLSLLNRLNRVERERSERPI